MRPARGLVRLVPPLALALAISLAGLAGQRAARASSLASKGSPGSQGSEGASAPAGSDAGGAKKKAHRPSSKKGAPKSKAAPDTKLTRSKSTHLARQKPARTQ